MALLERAPRPAASATPPKLAPLARQAKEAHYADWANQPLPALSGLTPRLAVSRPAARVQVDLLLKELEYLEGGVPATERFDVTRLRRELGL